MTVEELINELKEFKSDSVVLIEEINSGNKFPVSLVSRDVHQNACCCPGCPSKDTVFTVERVLLES